ncbi:MAG: hypothetical protein L0219_08285, partial [Phycisphaerales bacterium]|nr:hypothetical protein [Phycisphaerales bacterium]
MRKIALGSWMRIASVVVMAFLILLSCIWSVSSRLSRQVVKAQTQLGTVTELPEPCATGSLPNSTCRRLRVSCAGINPVDVQIRIMEPSGVAIRGTVVFSSGASGTGFYEGNSSSLFQSVTAMGFRVVDRAWAGPNGWTTSEGGMRKQACRYATLLTWLRDRIHIQGKFVVSGNSGGSAEIGYALTTWQRGDIIDLAIPTSGPAVARLDYACGNPPPHEWPALCTSILPPGALECAPSCSLGAGRGVCNQASSAPTLEILRNDSVVHPEAVLNYPKTRVHFLYGKRDCGESVPQGLTWSTNVTSQKVIEFVPNTPHVMASTVEGRAAIVNAIDLGTKQTAASVSTVSAASFRGSPLAAEAIVSAFGASLATATQSATVSPLPTTLAGTTVNVRDGAGTERLSPLFFVSPTQINYQIPAGTPTGGATITVTSGDG